MADYVFAALTGSVSHNGTTVRLVTGDVWEADHPLVTDRPDLFTGTPKRLNSRKADRPVEEASARPGSKRRTR